MKRGALLHITVHYYGLHNDKWNDERVKVTSRKDENISAANWHGINCYVIKIMDRANLYLAHCGFWGHSTAGFRKFNTFDWCFAVRYLILFIYSNSRPFEEELAENCLCAPVLHAPIPLVSIAMLFLEVWITKYIITESSINKIFHYFYISIPRWWIWCNLILNLVYKVRRNLVTRCQLKNVVPTRVIYNKTVT